VGEGGCVCLLLGRAEVEREEEGDDGDDGGRE